MFWPHHCRELGCRVNYLRKHLFFPIIISIIKIRILHIFILLKKNNSNKENFYGFQDKKSFEKFHHDSTLANFSGQLVVKNTTNFGGSK